MTLLTNELPIVLFHANCLDGTGAKYAAWRKFHDKAQYLPVQYGQPIPTIPDGSEVFILDFSYDRATLEALNARSKGLVVLDHHKTAMEALEGLPYAKFDMEQSGAVLAWKHFNPGKDVPDLLKIVQDRDLWKFQLAETKPVTAYLPLTKGDMEMWDYLVLNAKGFEDAAKGGSVKLQFDQMEIESAVKNAAIIGFEWMDEQGKKRTSRCAFYNANTLISEKGNYACTTLPVDFSLSYFVDKTGVAMLSFRSSKEHGDFDVSYLAKLYGGGGHRNAAGANNIPLSVISKLHSQVKQR